VKPLESEANVSLTSFRRNGTPVSTPVWIVGWEGRNYVNTAADSFKVKRIRSNPAVRLAPCTMRGKITGQWSGGRAGIVNDPAVIASVGRAMRAKYGWTVALTPLLGLLFRRFRERVILEITLDP